MNSDQPKVFTKSEVEFSNWNEYLTKLASHVYGVDPSYFQGDETIDIDYELVEEN